jgi:DNA ligase (NAD+)
MEFDGFGTKSCHKLIQAIEVAKNISFERLLYALGIDEVGEATSKALARAFEYPEALVSASFKSLIEIEDIGPKVASNILDYFADDFQKNEFLNLGSILNITFPKTIANNVLSDHLKVMEEMKSKRS